MPELPEVETVRQTLALLVTGKRIRNIDVFYEKMIRSHSVEEFESLLVDHTIEDISRYGKYLIFKIGKYALLSHLRMEGKYFLKDLEAPKEKHEHVIMYFYDGTTLRYHDTRKFGTMDVILYEDVYTNSPITKQGYEPFHSKMTGAYLKKQLSNKTIAIKSALLDQTIVSGLGNIYVDEVLFASKILPTTPSNTLSTKQYNLLAKHSELVLQKAVELGGTTIRSYTSSLGITGRFQNELKVHTKVNEPCEVCGTIIEKIKVNGRGTYYCKKCQK